jgi:hypothetical protein
MSVGDQATYSQSISNWSRPKGRERLCLCAKYMKDGICRPKKIPTKICPMDENLLAVQMWRHIGAPDDPEDLDVASKVRNLKFKNRENPAENSVLSTWEPQSVFQTQWTLPESLERKPGSGHLFTELTNHV